jgi:hypothetical protein
MEEVVGSNGPSKAFNHKGCYPSATEKRCREHLTTYNLEGTELGAS